MLKAFWLWLWPQEAKVERATRERDSVTREQLHAAIEEASKDLVFEWNEMYDKFEKLHLRLVKRADRESKKAHPHQPQLVEQEERPNILAHRRLGSI